VVSHTTALRVFEKVEQEVRLVCLLATRVQQIKDDDLVEIVLNSSVISEEEGLHKELLDGRLIDLGQSSIYGDHFLLGYLALDRNNEHSFNHIDAFCVAHGQLCLLGHELYQDSTHVLIAGVYAVEEARGTRGTVLLIIALFRAAAKEAEHCL
jgi:hypothetical protein